MGAEDFYDPYSGLTPGLPQIPGITPDMISGQLMNAGAGSILSGGLGGAASAGGALGKAGSVLNSALGFLGPVGAIAGTVGTIADMFKRSPQGNAKVDATRSQQNMEQWMKDIAAQAQSGALDPDTAIAMIQNIARQPIGNDQYGANAAGQAQVNAMANQIIGNLQQQRNWNLQAPMSGDKDRIMSGGNAAAPSFQKERGATLMRNLMMGTQLGKDFQGTGAPLGQAFNALPAAPENLGKSLQQVNKEFQGLFPTPANPNLGGTLKSKLAYYGK